MWWLFIGLGLWGCGSEEPEKPLETRAIEISSAAVNAVATNELEQPILTYESLDPKFAVAGAPDRAPQGLVLSFARPVIEQDNLKAELEISPSVVGNWVWMTTEFLLFSPTNGFKPDTKYTAKLTSLTNDGEPLGDISNIPSVTFQTPDFEFQSARMISKSWSVLRAEAVFSGPVKGDLELGLSATVDGQVGSSNSGSKVRVSASASASNRVQYRIELRGIRDATSVNLSIPSYEGVNGARSESVTYNLVGDETGTPMHIKKIERKEGATSQVISVICDDDAVEHERYFYERGYSGYISTRCLLDADRAGDFIEIHPKMDYKITGGRGGFNVVGDFQRGPVFVRINRGAPTVDGGILRDTVEKVLYMPGLQPKVEFAHSGRYLPKSSWRGMAIRHRNVDEVGVQVRRVPKANLLYWLSGADERTDHRTSDLVADTRFPVRGGEGRVDHDFCRPTRPCASG